MQTFDNWKKDLEEVHKAGKPNFYLGMLREFHNAGFWLASSGMAEAYFLLDEDQRESLDGEAYLKLCSFVEPLPGVFAYATHARSEEVFWAIHRCYEHFQPLDSEKPVWLMPPLDNEEMTSNTFVFLVGDAPEVLDKLRGIAAQRQV